MNFYDSLQSFKYVGPLSSSTLAAIIQTGSLRLLQLRNGNDVLGSHILAPNVPWVDTALDLSVLSGLRGLQTLEIGRLIRAEAGGSAKVVTPLNLRRLHVSCWGWDYANTIFKRSFTRTSVLVIFLDALMTLDLRGDKNGLRSTLKNLALIDKYPSDIPSLHQLLATAILPCENPEILNTTIIVSGKCYGEISNMRLLAYHKIIGFGSWQQLSCDGKVKVLYQYRGPSGDTFQTNPRFKPLCNIVMTLDQVIAATKGFGHYRVSMDLVRGRQFRADEILNLPLRRLRGRARSIRSGTRTPGLGCKHVGSRSGLQGNGTRRKVVDACATFVGHADQSFWNLMKGIKKACCIIDPSDCQPEMP